MSNHDFDEIPPGFKSGFVALAGRPNVGKSTLLNALVGEEVAIATPRPQTTRTRLRGIVNNPTSQIIFVDSPGIHQRNTAINRFMLEEAQAAMEEVDLIVLLVEAIGAGRQQAEKEPDDLVFDALRKANRKTILAINKIDRLNNKADLLPLLSKYEQSGLFEELIPISAKKKTGLEPLLVAIESRISEGPRYFSPDMYTDQPERMLVSEFIRQEVFVRVGDEVPYSVAVEIEAFEEEPEHNMIRIFGVLYAERDSQKGILIGKKGQMLKLIGSSARKKIERLLGCRVYLDLRVKVSKGWTRSEKGLSRVGYRKS